MRPARWFGTRLFPLVASALFLMVVANLPWWFVGLPLGVALEVLLGLSVCHVARVRDYA